MESPREEMRRVSEVLDLIAVALLGCSTLTIFVDFASTGAVASMVADVFVGMFGIAAGTVLFGGAIYRARPLDILGLGLVAIGCGLTVSLSLCTDMSAMALLPAAALWGSGGVLLALAAIVRIAIRCIYWLFDRSRDAAWRRRKSARSRVFGMGRLG